MFEVIGEDSIYSEQSGRDWFYESEPTRPTGTRGPMHDGATLEEIGWVLGVTKERVRQIEEKALKKCRTWCAQHGYALEDLLPVQERRYTDTLHDSEV